MLYSVEVEQDLLSVADLHSQVDVSMVGVVNGGSEKKGKENMPKLIVISV